MLEGLNTAAAGMAAQQQRLDSIANDLANANTTGYKHGRVGFRAVHKVKLVFQKLKGGHWKTAHKYTKTAMAAIRLGV